MNRKDYQKQYQKDNYKKLSFTVKKEDYNKYLEQSKEYNSISHMIKSKVDNYDNLLQIIERQKYIIDSFDKYSVEDIYNKLKNNLNPTH